VQVHIGLGWALAEQQKPIPENPSWPEPDAVLDGYGYYHGLFRRRLSIRTQSIPEGLTDTQLPAFDRGLGRSLWYISKGDVEMMLRMTAAFPERRQPDLWRGIGIAVAFVGGCSEPLLTQTASASSAYRPQLLEGAERALRSRTQAGTPTADAERAVRQWMQAI
jgi:enediyne biosynthesis protein E3